MTETNLERHPAKRYRGAWMLPGGVEVERDPESSPSSSREYTWVWLREYSDHEMVGYEASPKELDESACAEYCYQRRDAEARAGRPEQEIKSEQNMTTTDPTDPTTDPTIQDLIGEIADATSEGLRDGAAHALAATAATKLSSLAVRNGAPRHIAESRWVIHLLTALAPVLILVLIRVLREQLPRPILSLEAVAHRAVRGSASSYATVVVKIATEWLGSLLEDGPKQ
jgi:hypothetical protein